MTDHHHAFLTAIAAEPDNPAPKLIYADWLEEQGDPACEAWRWLAENDRQPNYAGWWDSGSSFVSNRHWIPREVFNELNIEAQHATYRTSVQQHYLDFVAAFAVARQAGWRPEWSEGGQATASHDATE